jgi:hypothetical protein
MHIFIFMIIVKVFYYCSFSQQCCSSMRMAIAPKDVGAI